MTEAVTRATTWTIDPVHSGLEFAVTHMMFTTVRGRFQTFAGAIVLDERQVERSSVEVTVRTDSIATNIAERDAHLRSADFLDAETWPEATFRSTRVEPKGENRFAVHGDLTIKDVSRAVVLDAAFHGTGMMPGGGEVAGFEATGTFSRKDFGLTWNVALEGGGVLVSDKVRLTLDIQAARASDRA
jgi:polyisoprenoid-binding protein YceI